MVVLKKHIDTALDAFNALEATQLSTVCCFN